MNSNSFLEEIEQRNLIQDSSNRDELSKVPAQSSFYFGVDPTAPYLHLGNLVGMSVAAILSRYSLKPIFLFGGSTGLIGDPGGRSTERPLLTVEQVQDNITQQSKKIHEFFDRCKLKVEFVNNYDWTKKITTIDFLREYGKHFSVNSMIAKEVIKTRLDDTGISFTEFSYMILQSLDFAYLYKNHNCHLQIGGSDQWGNLTSGLELIRKKYSATVHAFSFPLLLNSQGKKFGKSEGGALWIDERGTTPYKLHQYLLNIDDKDVERFLKVFSHKSLEQISEIVQASNQAPEKRIGQIELADELVYLLHGEKSVAEAKISAEILFGKSIDGLSKDQLADIFSEVPSYELQFNELKEKLIIDFFIISELCKSKGEAKRLFEQGGLYINNIRVQDINSSLSQEHFIGGDFLILRSGKKNYAIVKIIDR
jgi:tyrosyl-tRNA synthetase